MTLGERDMYIVRMKKVTASEARRQWFRLLDEAVQGEVIVVERDGNRLVIRRDDAKMRKAVAPGRRYGRLLRVSRASQADQWSWKWKSGGGLAAR